MINNKKVVVVLPAYNAALTLQQTYDEIPFDIVDDVILTDDHSTDNTVAVGKSLGIQHIIVHEKNRGYGGNQKSCYNKALELDADIVIMLHPDYQYTPKLIPSMVYLIANDVYDVVLGSRILNKGARKGGSEDFVFDNQMLGQLCYANMQIGEVSCPTKYFPEASSINFSRSVTYGLGVLGVSIKYFFHKNTFIKSKLFKAI